MAMFLKFIGPMRTLTQRGVRFEKGKVYKVIDEDRAFDMIESGRFQQVRDPSEKKAAPAEGRKYGGVRINRQRERRDTDMDMSERGDLSRDDLLNLSEKAEAEGEKSEAAEEQGPAVAEVKEQDDNRPKLPATQFTSKNGAVKWAKDNLGLDLDKHRSLSELNRTIVTEYGKRYAPPPSAEDDDDGTREENTKVDAVVVA